MDLFLFCFVFSVKKITSEIQNDDQETEPRERSNGKFKLMMTVIILFIISQLVIGQFPNTENNEQEYNVTKRKINQFYNFR